MPEATTRPWGCLRCMATFFLCAGVGLIVGVACTVLFYWLLDYVVREEALDPLADLKISKADLTTAETKEYIDKLASDYLRSGSNVGLAIGILKNGQSQFFGYGSVENGKDQTPTEDTIFELASAGKTFTSTVLADMHLRGELNLDDPVEKHLPGSVKTPKYLGREITLLDLATHSSGLPSLPDNMPMTDPLNPYADYTPEKMYEALGKMELAADARRQYAYSNLGFGLLGQALAQRAKVVAGLPTEPQSQPARSGDRPEQWSYESLVIERLCTPLQMTSTRMTLDESLKSRLATPHDGGKPVPVWEDLTMAGAGSFLSTPGDMLKYLQAHLSDQEGSPYDAMRLSTRKHRPTDSPQTAIGLAWHITSENALDIAWHNGGSGGSRSYIALLPDARIGVVVLSNSTSSVDELGHKLVYLVHRHWRPEE